SARSSYSFFAWFLASLILASASLVLLYSLKVRFISTVPIFRVPWARAAMGRTSKEARVKKSNFFIRGVNKSSETRRTASVNISLKLVADAEVEMAVIGVAGGINRDAIIEAQWTNREVEANADAEISRQIIIRPPRSYR